MRRLAAMGGTYGNLAALDACQYDATGLGAEARAFLGDAIGCCGHSEEVVARIRAGFDVLVAGNHEQQAAAREDGCGCGYSSPDDEAISCEAFELATAALSETTKDELGRWPDHAIVALEGGRVLLCHGSPGSTNEFLYEHELDDARLEAWLDEFAVVGFVCTHSGLPFIRRLRGGRFAVNCGAVGKADHDGDPAVHYAFLDLPRGAAPRLEIRRVGYDHEGWAARMEAAGIRPIFVEPIRTGVWTTGAASLPASERHRPLRAGSLAGAPPTAWRRDSVARVLTAFRELGLLNALECDEVLALLSPAFPFFSQVRAADSLHLHIKVEDTEKLPRALILGLGAELENARPGYLKFVFAGGINMIFSSIPVADEDTLPGDLALEKPKPFLDHVGIDLRREIGLVRAVFDDVPMLARRAGWAHKSQGGPGRPVYCCHAQVGVKHWVYPLRGRFSVPVEFAFGPLVISQETNGCDLRPIDPRHPASAEFVACAP